MRQLRRNRYFTPFLKCTYFKSFIEKSVLKSKSAHMAQSYSRCFNVPVNPILRVILIAFALY